jgi:hypothetical protein
VISQARESRDNPILNAFCRVAPSLRFSFLAIFPAGVFVRASDFSSRISLASQARLFAFLAMWSPLILKSNWLICPGDFKGKTPAASDDELPEGTSSKKHIQQMRAVEATSPDQASTSSKAESGRPWRSIDQSPASRPNGRATLIASGAVPVACSMRSCVSDDLNPAIPKL